MYQTTTALMISRMLANGWGQAKTTAPDGTLIEVTLNGTRFAVVLYRRDKAPSASDLRDALSGFKPVPSAYEVSRVSTNNRFGARFGIRAEWSL